MADEVSPVIRLRQRNCIGSRGAEDHGWIKGLADKTHHCAFCGVSKPDWEQMMNEMWYSPGINSAQSGPTGYP
jgi:hypothetical protein